MDYTTAEAATAHRHIWLLRHAKAEPVGPSRVGPSRVGPSRVGPSRVGPSSGDTQPSKDDLSRHITHRGIRQARAVAARFVELQHGPLRGTLPELVVCSPATRALETAELAMAGLPGVRLEVEQFLYRADVDEVTNRLRELPAEIVSVMLVGHNPTISHLVRHLTGTVAPGVHGGLVYDGMPTGALVGMSMPQDSSCSYPRPCRFCSNTS